MASEKLNESLLTSAFGGDQTDVERLISKGADVNFINEFGQAPLNLAAEKGHLSVTQSPLHCAAGQGHDSVIETLILFGAKFDEKDSEGRTPLTMIARNRNESKLHSAVRFSIMPAISLCLQNGEPVNGRNKAGETPLHIAVQQKKEDTITCLLKHKASFIEKDYQGLTPLYMASRNWKERQLHSAARYGIAEAVMTCLQNGDHVNEVNSEKYTPLHLAVINGHKSVTVKLLEHGAQIEKKDPQGLTAIDLAERLKHQHIMKLFKGILATGLPKELLYLSTNDSATFTSNLRSGFYLSYVGKIMCVGNEAVGKTAITSVLRAKKPTRERKSTEGIDLHVFKAAVDINERKWVLTAELEKLSTVINPPELDLEDIVFRDLLSEQNINIPNINNLYEEYNADDAIVDSKMECDVQEIGTESPKEQNMECDVDQIGTESPKEQSGASRGAFLKFWPLPKIEFTSLFNKIKQSLGIKKADIRTGREIQRESIRRGKKGLIKNSLAPINMMDFGGQIVFYSTHQSFLSYRAIYILVIDGSRDFDAVIETEMCIPGRYGKPTAREFTLFWVNSIASLSTGGSDMFPKILVVCTHKDQVHEDTPSDKVDKIFTEIEKMFDGTPALKHLVLEHRIFLNAIDPDDNGYEILKNVLVELLCIQPSWGEKLPKSWLYLKIMINRSLENGDAIIEMKQLKQINDTNPMQKLSDEDLQLFLKMQHAQGEIIYFSLFGLQDKIVISPQFLVDALRSFVTDKTFCEGYRLKTIESLSRNGLLKKKDIEEIWKNKKRFLEHKTYLLELMGHLDIIATPRIYSDVGSLLESDFYYVPSIVKVKDDISYFNQVLASKAIGLSFKFKSSVIPPAIGYRLIASCIDMFEVQRYNDNAMLFSGMVVLCVKTNLDLIVLLRSDRVDIFLLPSASRFDIVRDTATGITACFENILKSILEGYRETRSESGFECELPFHTEYPCFDMVKPCYNRDEENWTCVHHHQITREMKYKWKVNRDKEYCPDECEGLKGTDLTEKPSELHLAKLARQFSWIDMYNLVIKLGLDVPTIQAIEVDNAGNVLNAMFQCLFKWKKKTEGTVGHLIKAMQEMNIDVHAACKMIRDKPMNVAEEVLNNEPTDKILDAISTAVITESMFLSIELGQSSDDWFGMMQQRCKIVHINRQVLRKWRDKHKGKNKMRVLAQALCNVDVNIEAFLPNKSYAERLV